MLVALLLSGETHLTAERLNLRIYNVLGQPIRTLVAGRLTPGHHRVPWEGRNDRGESVSSGVYL